MFRFYFFLFVVEYKRMYIVFNLVFFYMYI